jgi:hypothetical protein
MRRAVARAAALLLITACTNNAKAPGGSTAASTSGSIAVTTTISTTVSTTVSATTGRRPLARVMTIGDGVMFDLEPALIAALSPASVRPTAYFGSGLTRPEQYDWEHNWAAAITSTRPEVVVVLLGVWDARAAVTAGATTYQLGSPQWVSWYRSLLQASSQILTAQGAAIVWVLPLAESDREKSGRLSVVRAVIRDWARDTPGVTVVEGNSALSGRPEEFASSGPDGTRLRKNDGEHLCPAGAAVLADAVRAAVTPSFSLPADWDHSGAWTTDERYRQDGEGCLR